VEAGVADVSISEVESDGEIGLLALLYVYISVVLGGMFE
jgi:hypothetical protein